MKIAVLSGKGGTGKTFISVNLAAVWENSYYADCDIEEPNGYLFFKPENTEKENVSVKIPVINHFECTGCRKCVSFCKFSALAFIKNRVTVFSALCHSCGGCRILCPEQAVTETDREIGYIEKGMSERITVLTGCLNTGEASGVPIIKRMTEMLPPKGNSVIDCPPGSACTVMESIKNSDYCILVAEPTIFGVHNMDMVYGLVKHFNKPFGAVINKYTNEDNPAAVFCRENNIKTLEKIPYDENLGKMISKGDIAAREKPVYNEMFKKLLEKICRESAL